MNELSLSDNQLVLLDYILSRIMRCAEFEYDNLVTFPDVLISFCPDDFEDVKKIHAAVKERL